MSVTLESKLCPEVPELLEQYGEYVYCVSIEDSKPVLSTAYTRTLVSPILRKYTQLVEYSKIPSVYNTHLPSTPPSHSPDEHVYVLDLTSPLILSSYKKVKARYFPITTLYEKMTSLLEYYSLDELLQLLAVRISFLAEENVKSFDIEVESLILLIREYPNLTKSEHFIELLQSPPLEDSAYRVLEEVYKHDRLHAIVLGHAFEPYFLLNREYCVTGNRVSSHFRPINDPLSGISLMSDSYIHKCMSELAGKWVSELDYSKCVITGSMVAACITSVTWSTTTEDVSKFYPSAFTESVDGLNYMKRYGFLGRYRGNTLEMSDKHTINGDTLTCFFYDEIHGEHKDFKVTPGVDVNIYISPNEDPIEVANAIYSTVSKCWKSVVLVQEENKWVITSPDMSDYINGFRTVTMCVANKHSVLHHKVPCTRGYYDGTTIHGTRSCFTFTVGKPIGNNHCVGCSENMKHKYSARGYNFDIQNGGKLRDYNVLSEYKTSEVRYIPQYTLKLLERVASSHCLSEPYPHEDDIREELRDIARIWYNYGE